MRKQISGAPSPIPHSGLLALALLARPDNKATHGDPAREAAADGGRPIWRYRGLAQGDVARLSAGSGDRGGRNARGRLPVGPLWRAADADGAADRARAQFPQRLCAVDAWPGLPTAIAAVLGTFAGPPRHH